MYVSLVIEMLLSPVKCVYYLLFITSCCLTYCGIVSNTHVVWCAILSCFVSYCDIMSDFWELFNLPLVSLTILWHCLALMVSCCAVPCRVVSMSCHVMSCHVMSCHVMSCHVMSCHVMSCHVMSCHVTSRHVTSRHVTSRHVTSRDVTSRHVTSRHVMSMSMSSVLSVIHVTLWHNVCIVTMYPVICVM